MNEDMNVCNIYIYATVMCIYIKRARAQCLEEKKYRFNYIASAPEESINEHYTDMTRSAHSTLALS